MAPVKKLAGGARSVTGRAVRAAEHGAAAAVGIRLARSLYGRWHRMSSAERERLRELAEGVKDLALDLRGARDQPAAQRELHEANERLADAIVESAESNPEVSEIEVRRLRADLARELERLSNADIKASRGTGERAQ